MIRISGRPLTPCYLAVKRRDGVGLARQLEPQHRHRERFSRAHCVFTTHTPVAAGHDRFVPALFIEQMESFREEIGLSEQALLAYGRVHPHDAGEWTRP